MPSPIHVGFLARDFLKWGGGVWFIQNLLRGLSSLPAEQVRITVIAPTDSSVPIRARQMASRAKQALLNPGRAWHHLFRSAAEDRALRERGIRQLTAIVPELALFDGSDADLLRCSARLGVDVLMPVMTPPATSAIPWVGYLYDCQHKHYPQFFMPKELARRDAAFDEMLHRATIVFANAQAVLTDLRHYFPHGRAALDSLPFAPLILEDELAATVRDTPAVKLSQAGGAPYFIVCNQFWTHKDHATAFRAFAQFADDPSHRHWRLICTGLTEDYRVPGHFAQLKALLDELRIADRVTFTGYIDRALQQSLLYGAVGLLQPTLFEGGPGGGAASDAMSLGVPSLLSDIAVNRELADPIVSFFTVGDPSSLAGAMIELVRRPPARPSPEVLLANSRERARMLGAKLLELAQQALAAGVGTSARR